MLVDHSREKLLNVIVYFAQKTKNCAKTKLLKLLFFLDFEHFRETGRSVTGLKYFAWDLGPVPVELYEEMTEKPKPDFLEKVNIKYKNEYGYERPTEKVVACVEFDPSHFSRRELRIMERLAKENYDKSGTSLADLTHEENSVWSLVWNDEKGKYKEIPYELSLRSLTDEEQEQVKTLMQESKEFRENFA